MRDALFAYEPYIRLGAFGGVFAVMAIWELFGPRRKQAIRRGWRWPNNLGVVVVNTLLVRLVFPTTAVGLSLLAETRGWGLFNLMAFPAWVGVISSVVVLDLAIYLQHVLFHAVPSLWRLHRMHHADLEFDVSTGLRFHPIEILLSMVIKFTVVAGAWGARSCRVDLRGAAERDVHVQSWQRPHPHGPRSHAALDRRHAGYAPSAPFDPVTRDQQQFWIQPTLVGPPVRHLPRPAHRRARRHDDRHRAVPRTARARARSHVASALPRRCRPLSARTAGRRAMSMRRFLPRLVLALLLVAAIAWVAVHREQINLETLDSWLASLGSWAPIGYMIIFALATVAFAPGAIFSLIGGALFGPVWGSLWNLLGATLGATLAFLVARYIVGDWVRHKAGGLLKRLIDGVDAEGWRFVAFVRLVPLFPFNLSNYVLGLTRIPLHHYVIATLVCMAPGAVAYTWLGHAGRGALTGEADTVRYGLLALGLLAAIALLPRLIGRMRRHSHGLRQTISSAVSIAAKR